MRQHTRTSVQTVGALLALCFSTAARGEEVPVQVRTFLTTHCVRCHGADKARGDLNFEEVLANRAGVAGDFKAWRVSAARVADREMPPAGERQPTGAERAAFAEWYRSAATALRVEPAPVRVRRLSVEEYKRTVESLFGFALPVATVRAEQTRAETSLVRKLLPTDPLGPSGFTNDTSTSPISPKALEAYAYIAEAAAAKLFAPDGRDALERHCGPVRGGALTAAQGAELLDAFQARSQRRPITAADRDAHAKLVKGLGGAQLEAVLKRELKYLAVAPEFLYRGLLATRGTGVGPVDGFELAERLSYFLWADMPDDELLAAAAADTLARPDGLRAQVQRMLKSPRSRSLAEVFAVEWLQLNEIDGASREVPYAAALKGQPVEFLNDLVARNRPLKELIDSKTEFVNAYLANYYAPDAARFPAAARRAGVELEALPLARIELLGTPGRGGLLTMPGVLAMNKGPIQRGKWVLERVLGEHLGEPPPNVPAVKPSKAGGASFRKRFEDHRANAACASCHDRIDPVGFAFEAYADGGGFRLASDFASQRVSKAPPPKKPAVTRVADPAVDASGVLPSGEKFADFEEFKALLTTTLWPRVVENVVRRTLAYALCRELGAGDEKVVADLTARLARPGATWGDLIDGVVTSPLFRDATFPEAPPAPGPR
ncbi:planctomycete cytochrome c domain protein : Uncharacterized protein OS=Lentisphaera araneosa HTCC2155 GN=LNTAR_07859 PE=4 SV=1: PSD3: PSD4: PSCyt3: PSD2 [Gemmataceae bacterium]|nr:planctomycete cytochrome c domain protein : Uncharacterized protein OS=Lentisphaera araneosa HTCC2155 GN=LNTAR_07859 PE=4 SV=1: PSD3: PSD4: PSCyt3: PSD2 [Gemmataceae bacterium]VTU02579.1 planctomycete cytochrome c domain protein : Uncharacterized protein OS=Lentisphaera araneosa HTCC2155 GN=LNTAR_07859 PE=4 SV=1: PSD3: PSD4: PSCyt3: PSD2 [Gemmataceae bacterium]